MKLMRWFCDCADLEPGSDPLCEEGDSSLNTPSDLLQRLLGVEPGRIEALLAGANVGTAAQSLGVGDTAARSVVSS